MRRSQLVRLLASIPPPVHADARLEQVGTPPELALDLLEFALARGDLVGRSVLDLGSGIGILAIGAALLGASPVSGVEIDAAAVPAARASAGRLGAEVRFEEGDVAAYRGRARTIVMNPPFGAQSAHADRPFWEAAFTLADGAVHAFALADSRTFIERRALSHSVRVVDRRPVRFPIPRSFPHHRKPVREVEVDAWAFETGQEP